MAASERTLALRAARAGFPVDQVLLELKDLRIAQERSAEALEAILALLQAAPAKPFVHGETKLTGEDRRKLRAILPVLLAQYGDGSFLAGEVVEAAAYDKSADGADLAAALEVPCQPSAQDLRQISQALGILLGKAADATTDDVAFEGFRVLRGTMPGKSQRWLIETM